MMINQLKFQRTKAVSAAAAAAAAAVLKVKTTTFSHHSFHMASTSPAQKIAEIFYLQNYNSKSVRSAKHRSAKLETFSREIRNYFFTIINLNSQSATADRTPITKLPPLMPPQPQPISFSKPALLMPPSTPTANQLIKTCVSNESALDTYLDK